MLCSGTPQAARARQAGDLQLPGLHLHLRQDPRGQIPASTEDPAGPPADEASDDQRGDVAAYASADPRSGEMAMARRPRLLQLPCGPDQLPGTRGIPDRDSQTLASGAHPTQRADYAQLGTDEAADWRVASPTAHTSPLARQALCRLIPKVGAVCGKAARTDLCGGPLAMEVPTATTAVRSSRFLAARRRGLSPRARSFPKECRVSAGWSRAHPHPTDFHSPH